MAAASMDAEALKALAGYDSISAVPAPTNFDESKLVKPGEWDKLANPDLDAMKEMERLIDDEFLQMKASVEAEKAAKKEAKRAAKAEAEAASVEIHLPAGAKVLIDGLTARPELNGKTGHILSFNAGRGRYAVAVTGGDTEDGILLKHMNLRAVDSCPLED